MFANDITVKDRSNADVTFKLIQLEGTESVRKTAASTLQLPNRMRIARTESSSSGAGASNLPSTRYLVSFSKTEATSNGGRAAVVVNTTIQWPHDTAFTIEDVKDMIAHVQSFLSDSSNVTELLQGGL